MGSYWVWSACAQACDKTDEQQIMGSFSPLSSCSLMWFYKLNFASSRLEGPQTWFQLVFESCNETKILICAARFHP